jgi:steroid 5-alpha reductase family enzyme
MLSNPLIQAAFWCALASLLAWAISLAKHDASIADVFWPWLGVGCGVIYLLNALPPSSIAWVTLAGITVAAVRLSAMVISRIARSGEDRRYTEIRSSWGAGFGLKCLPGIFLLQGAMGFVTALPLAVVMARSGAFRVMDALIIGLWLAGFVIQTAADRQLTKFARADDGTGVLRTGLWRYSRHPNYFGELCMAWSIFGLALVGGGGWTLFAPLLLTWSILRFTGVTRMEREMPSRRPQYAAYASVTSALFPWPPRGEKP